MILSEKTERSALLFFAECGNIFSELAEVMEWQTWRTQNPLVAIPCGFKSRLRHHIKYRLLIQRLVLFFYLRVDQMPLPQGLSRAFSWKSILIWLSLINGASCPACGLRLTPRRTGSIATGGRIGSVSWTTPPFNIEEYFFAYGVFLGIRSHKRESWRSISSNFGRPVLPSWG